MPLRAECFEESSDEEHVARAVTAMPLGSSKNVSRESSDAQTCCTERKRDGVVRGDSEKAQKKLEKKKVIPKTFRTRRYL